MGVGWWRDPNGSSAQQRKYREDPTVAVVVQFDIELAEHLGTGRLDGSFADLKASCDAGVRARLCHQAQDLVFSVGQPVQ
jgi:hypothetical protein